ncbi:MAG: Asp-tRNA(Asn)/Glu-tRNA(Gln) amidotransferase subunit GatC [Phycisphaerales bacterium]|nr:Asp-tRNA(Asn)/Glu-tRNA(Gln) amidotransferase subunit GatC [Phycisphaerales bacterium]
MAPTAADLTAEEVAHVAKLARLCLDPDRLEAYRAQLSSILGHIASLKSVDVSGVEPMAHPLSISNQLADDVPGPTLSLEQVLMNAPAREGAFIAVPKVLDEGSA